MKKLALAIALLVCALLRVGPASADPTASPPGLSATTEHAVLEIMLQATMPEFLTQAEQVEAFDASAPAEAGKCFLAVAKLAEGLELTRHGPTEAEFVYLGKKSSPDPKAIHKPPARSRTT